MTSFEFLSEGKSQMDSLFFLIILLYHCVLAVPHGMLVPRAGIKPEPPAEAWSLDHRTTREVPR